MKRVISILFAYLLLAFVLCVACKEPPEEVVSESVDINAGFSKFLSDITLLRGLDEAKLRTKSRLEVINICRYGDEEEEASVSQADLDLLATVIRAEAGNQSQAGKRAVADVILNRVISDEFPDSIAEVVYQEGQFTCVRDGNFYEAVYTKDETDYEAALAELSGVTDSEILYFQTNSYSPYGTPAYIIGDHYFAKQ